MRFADSNRFEFEKPLQAAEKSRDGTAAALRITFLVILALCGGFSSAATAGGIDPVGTVTGALSTIASQTTVASDLTGQTTVVTSQTSGTSDATDAATGLVSGATSGGTNAISGDSGATGLVGTATSGGGGGGGGTSSASGDSSTSASSGSGDAKQSSKHTSTRTRFDRLPRRYELLLERIEAGHRVRASIARLRSLFATATPRMRARILRLIRSEIRRLERNGLTRRERAFARRLHRLLAKLTAQPSRPSAAAAMSRPMFPASATTVIRDDRAAGVAGTGVAGTEASGRSPSEGGGPNLHIGGVPLPMPPPPSESLRWLSILLWALVIAAVTMAAQQVIKDLKK